MYNFLMVSTVFSKKQFSVLSVTKEELPTLAQDLAKGRNHLILYPCLNKQNIKDISDLIDAKTKVALLSDTANKKLGVKNWTGFKSKGVVFIEHLHDEFFRIHTEKSSFVSSEFELYI